MTGAAEQDVLERLEAAIDRRMTAADGMLDALPASDRLDREHAQARLRAAFERIHETGSLLPGGWAGLWILLLAFLAAPALPAQWSGGEHALGADIALYVVTLVLGGFVARSAAARLPDRQRGSVRRAPGRDLGVARADRGRGRARAAAVRPARGGRRRGARRDRRRAVGAPGRSLELVCLVLLSPLIAALLATVSALARVRALKRRLMQTSRREHYDAFAGELTDLLAAAVDGDWGPLTSAEAPPRTPRRLRRAADLLVPTAVLAAAAFARPRSPA